MLVIEVLPLNLKNLYLIYSVVDFVVFQLHNSHLQKESQLKTINYNDVGALLWIGHVTL